jgi:hypothetical protein
MFAVGALISWVISWLVAAQTVPDLPVTEIPFESQPDQGSNPIRQGIDAVMDNLEWSFAVESDPTFESSLGRVISQINVIINYVLWLLALIALVYLIYHGFIMLFALNKEDQFNKWLKWIKTAAIALIGVWLSRVIVRFIFFIINLVAW